jgi:hypothetical protein
MLGIIFCATCRLCMFCGYRFGPGHVLGCTVNNLLHNKYILAVCGPKWYTMTISWIAVYLTLSNIRYLLGILDSNK